MDGSSPNHRLDLRARTIARWLSWLGIIPFIALALVNASTGFEWTQTPLVVYAMLILAFMAGAHWIALINGNRSSPNAGFELIATNVLVLGAWPAIAMPTAWASLWLGLLFCFHLALDTPWRVQAGPAWYRHMRVGLSLVVITTLILGGLIGLGLTFKPS